MGHVTQATLPTPNCKVEIRITFPPIFQNHCKNEIR